jgi:hypothetical protein
MTTFPKIDSAGLRGAKAEGSRQLSDASLDAEVKSIMERADETLLRELLKQALGTLDTIAMVPIPGDNYPHEKGDRALAKMTAKFIRSELSK